MNCIIATMAGVVFACACFVQPGCTPSTNTTAPADAGGAAALCAHLNEIGCTQLPDCAQTVLRIEQDRLTDLQEAKLRQASSRAEAVAVGTVACQTPAQ